MDSEEYGGTEFKMPEIPANHNFDYTPEELRKKMGEASWRFEQACMRMSKLRVTKTIRQKKTMIILGARRFDMLVNTKLREYLKETFEKDSKLRPTKEQYDAWVHVEHQAVFDEYEFFEAQAKEAEKDHEHWGWQLSYHQSLMKKDGIEMMTLEQGGKGHTGGRR